MTFDTAKELIKKVVCVDNRVSQVFVLPSTYTTEKQVSTEVEIVLNTKGRLLGFDLYDIEEKLEIALERTVRVYDLAEIAQNKDLVTKWQKSKCIYGNQKAK